MFGYQRSASYGTAIDHILHGSFTGLSKSDVVLVKGHSLELLEIAQNPEESRAILQSTFEQPAFGIITDARTLSCNFGDSMGPDNDDTTATTNMTGTTTTVVTDMEYENEHSIAISDDDEEEHDDCVEIPFMFKLRQGHAKIAGNDVIVAISEYGKLMFWSVTAGASSLSDNHDDLGRTGRFEPLVEVCMDEPGLEYDKVSKKLAIDPHSRAIAVASFQDRFDIMILRNSMSRTNFNPFIGMGKVIEEGIIWHMEFLHTETTSRDRILLALVVYSDVDHQCRIIVYSIDASNANDIEIERIGRLPLDTINFRYGGTPVPILLIPLRHYPEALVLLTEYEAGIVTTDDIACGNMLYPTCPIERPFGEVKCPLFTAYAYSPGDIEPSISSPSSEYYIFLGADDGSLFKMIFPSRHEIRWEILDPVNAVAPAMSVLGTLLMGDEMAGDEPQAYLADVLFYAGEGADSQILAIDRSTNSKRAHVVLQTLTNRAPIVDSRLATVMEDEQNAIISCSGQANHGALTIVSRGVQTSLIQKSTTRWDGFTRLWNTQGPVSESTIATALVASSVLETRLMLIQDGELSDMTDSVGIDARQGTVAAGFVTVVKQSGTNATHVPIFVQICKDGIRLIDNIKNGHIVGHWSPKAFDPESNYVITLATIIQAEAYPSQIIICLSNGYKHALLPLDIVYENQRVTLLPLLGEIPISEPSFIHHFDSPSNNRIWRGPIVVVGTYEPALLIYSLQGTEGVQLICEKKLACMAGQEACVVPHSATLLYGKDEDDYMSKTSANHRNDGDDNGMHCFLLLGLRQGTVLIFRVVPGSQQLLSDASPAVLSIGTFAVDFDTGNKNKSIVSVLALSDRLWRIKYNSLCPQLLEVEPVLLPNLFSTVEAVISLATVVVGEEQKNDGSIVVGAVADGYFHILHLASNCSIGTRKIPIGETPNKILYDKPSNCAFVVTTAMKDPAVKSTMRLVDLSSTGTKAKDKILLSSKDFGFSDEILCMTEWTVAHRERTYRYLCLGIGQKNISTRSRIRKIGTERGVLMLYRLKSTGRSTSSTESIPSVLSTPTDGLNCYSLRAVWNQEHFPGGIFAICPHPAGLLFSAGHVLHLYQLDPRQGILVEITRKALRFLITSIHVDDDIICVTCQNDSISFYTFNEQDRKLDFYKSDTTARTIHHSVLLNNQIAVGAYQSGGLTALRDDPDDRSFEQRLLSVFSFHYPDIIIRPTLGSLLPRNLLGAPSHNKHIAPHVLAWVQEEEMEEEGQTTDNNNISTAPIEPIIGSTVAGGLVTVHRISPTLFDLFSTLQDRLVHYASSLFIILGSPKNFHWFRGLNTRKQQQHNIIHGDLLTLYLRLTPEQQQEVIQLELSKDESQKQQVMFLNAIRAFLEVTSTSLDEHATNLRQNLLRKRTAVSAGTTVTIENNSEGHGNHENDDVDDGDEEDVELLYTYSGEIAWMMDRLLRAMERYC